MAGQQQLQQGMAEVSLEDKTELSMKEGRELGTGDEADAIKIGKKLFGREERGGEAEQGAGQQPEQPVKQVQWAEEEAGDEKAQVRITPGDQYPTTNPRRGVCLVLENDMFHTSLGLSQRKGSSLDRTAMINTFSRLQFEVGTLLGTQENVDVLLPCYCSV